MPRIRLLASALALAICSISTAAASTAQVPLFTGVISFGDSLSDDGNVAALNGLPAGNSFTTNPDPEAVQLIASEYGFNQTNISKFIPGSSGTDYAYGGACVQANVAGGFTCGLSPGGFSLTTQVSDYLTAHGGKADSQALYTMWGGANDIFTYLNLAGHGLISAQQAAIGVATAAHTEAGLINALQTAGAGNIIVFNLPNIGATPALTAQGPAAQGAATQLSLIYNTQLNGTMSGKTGIIAVDTFGLVNEVLANHAAYGFANVTGMACSTGPGIGGLPSSVACGGPSAIGHLPYTYAAGTNLSYFFADGVHPTGAAQALLAQYVVAEIAAPSSISMLGEAPLHVFETHTRAVGDQMQADMARTRAAGSLRTFASIDYSHQRYDSTSTSPATSSHNSTLTMGGDYYVNDDVSVGLVSSIGYQDASFGNGGGYRQTEPLLSGYGVWRMQDAYVSLLASVGQLNFNNVERDIKLGALTRIESGDTSGSHTGVELAGGYFFHWGDIKSGPFASIASQQVHVGSYSETGNDSTAMTFGRQSRNSTIAKLGWQLSGDSKMFDSNLHPFARVAYEHESDNSVRNVSAGLVGLNGTFSMPGYQPDSSWWDAELGLSADFGSNFTGYAAYNGRFGDSSQRVDSFNVGMKFSF